MLKKSCQKLNSRIGASIGEMLVCVLILLLASSALVTGVTLASNNFEKSFSSSQAQTICSTLMAAVEGELRYTDGVTVTKGTDYKVAGTDGSKYGGGAVKSFTFKSVEHAGYTVYFGQDDDGRVVLADTNKEAVIKTYDLVAPGTYSHNLQASVTVNTIKTKKVGDTIKATSFNVTISITRSNGDVVDSATFDVIPVDHPEVTEKSAE